MTTIRDAMLSLIPLSALQRRRLPRPRRLFHTHVETLVNVYRTHQNVLFIEGYDPQRTLDTFATWKALARAENDALVHLKKIRETRLLHSSTVWTDMLMIYARARVSGRQSPVLLRAIGPFARFMRHARRKKAPAKKSAT